MRQRRKKNAGMTLLEIVVALSILTIFMGIAIPSLMKSMRATSQAKRLTVRYPNARKALRQMSTMMRQAYPTGLESGIGFTGTSSAYEAGGIMIPRDNVSFPVLDTGYSHLNSMQKISYRLELNPANENAPRGLVQDRSFFGADAAAGTTEMLLDRVIGLDLTYLNDSQDSPEWVSEWPPESVDQERPALPKAIKITLYVAGEISLRPTPFTTVVNVPSR